MKKKIKFQLFKLIAILFLLSGVTFYSSTEVQASEGWVTITRAGQVVDSITFNGKTVDAIYAPRNQVANYDSDTTYCCAAFVKRFYSTVFGVNVYNLFPGNAPLGASFTKTSYPVAGDIAAFYGHWGIVKAVSGNNVTIIEQNRWWNDKGSTGRTIDKSAVEYGFYHYSGNNPPASDTTKPSISNVRITDINVDGYTVVCDVSDNVGVTSVRFPSWNCDIHTGENANWLTGSVSGNTASCRINISSLQSGVREGNYLTHIYAYDAAGNATCAHANVVYIDRTAPVISSAEVFNIDAEGYNVRIVATDNHSLNRVQCPSWTKKDGQDDIVPEWWTNPKVKAQFMGNNTYEFRVNRSEHNNEYGVYLTHIYVYDANGNAAITSINTINVNREMHPRAMCTYDNSIYGVFNEKYDWDKLNSMAEGFGGYLATITSKQEDEALADLLKNATWPYYFIGGIKNGDGWKWMSGEDFSYTNWAPHQPDFAANNEFYLSLSTNENCTWNDLNADYQRAGFVVEVPLSLKPCKTLIYKNKQYEFYKETLPYEMARYYAKCKGGALAMPKDSATIKVLSKVAKNINHDFYLGATDCAEEGVFVWEDGTTVENFNWGPNEPNNLASEGQQNYLKMQEDGLWDDDNNYNSMVGFVVEYDKTPTINDEQDTIPNLKEDEDTIPNLKEDENNSNIGGSGTNKNNDITKIANVTIRKIKPSKKKLSVFWKSVSNQNGYQIQCARNKSFTKNRKVINCGHMANQVTIKKLKSKKTYYLRIRACKLNNAGQLVYGKWSSIKKCKVK